MAVYGKLTLETKGQIMQFDIDYAQCSLSGSDPIAFSIDLDTIKKSVDIEEGFNRVVGASVYIVKYYKCVSNIHECIREFDSSDGECVFSFLDHEELYEVTFRNFEVDGETVHIELQGKTVNVVSTDPTEFTIVTVQAKAHLNVNLPEVLLKDKNFMS